MEKIVLASNNKNKLKEFREIFKDNEILSLNDIGYSKDIEETGNTFLENALIKAKTISKYLKELGLKYDVISDDSGLCCNALNGEPGIYSARYCGEYGDDAKNRKKVINELKNKTDKSAYFICVIVLYHSDGKYSSYTGKTYGKIIDEKRGDLTFGYDPIFLSDDLNKTFGEASSDEKNKVSHRGRAIEKLKYDLKCYTDLI